MCTYVPNTSNNRLPTLAALEGFLEEVGFTLRPTVILTEVIFQSEHWLDKEGPFRQEWRDTDRYIDCPWVCAKLPY